MLYDRFYYSTLDFASKAVYKNIYNALQNFEDRLNLSRSQYDGVNIDDVLNCIALDNPHIFYVDLNNVTIYLNAFRARIKFTYWYTRDEVSAINVKVNKVMGKMLSKVQGNTDYDKLLSLHTLLLKNVLYDDVALENIRAHSPRSNTMLGVLFYKKAVCEGIAKTAKMLLNLMGIKCIVAEGSGDNELHAWNIVKLDGKAYHLDITWDVNHSSKDYLRRDYFCLSDDQMRRDHSWNRSYPVCSDGKSAYYIKNNLTANSAQNVYRLLCKTLNEGKRILTFKFTGQCIAAKDVINQASNALDSVVTPYTRIDTYTNVAQQIFTVTFS